MNYLIKNNNRGDKKKKKILFGVLFFVVISIFASSFFSGVFSRIGGVIWNSENFISRSIRDTVELFQSKATLLAENEDLKKRLETMVVDALATDIMRQENSDLKEILGRTDDKKVLLASVLRTPPFSPYDTFILDVGANKEVQIGDYIFVGGHVLVGEIVEVNPTSAKAQLFSAPGKTLAVLIGKKAISVEAVGRGGGNFEVILSREIPIAVGESVIVPQIDSMVLGVVGQVDIDPAKTFQRVLFSTPVNIQGVRWVTVVKASLLR